MLIKLPKYVTCEPDHRGNVRYYYRRYGRRMRLRGVPGDDEFWNSLAEVVNKPPAELGTESTNRQNDIKSFVYFLRFGNSKVKIGTCLNVKSRMQSLRSGIPGKARVYYVTPGGYALERELHKLFAADRITGEWFMYSKAIHDWIAADEERRRRARMASLRT